MFFLLCRFSLLFCVVLGSSVAEPEYLFENDIYVQEFKSVGSMQTVLAGLAAEPRPELSAAIPDVSREQQEGAVHLVLYYAHWCPHCHSLAPTWSSLASVLICTPGISILAFECSQASGGRSSHGLSPSQFCRSQGVKGYPTLIAYWREKDADGSYSVRKESIIADRTLNALKKWILDKTPVKDMRKCIGPNPDHQKPGDLDASLDRTEVMAPDRWAQKRIGTCPDTRLHDALVALAYLLRNWVVDSGGLLDKEKAGQLHRLLSVAGPLFPGRNIQATIQHLAQKVQGTKSMSGMEYHAILDSLDLGGLKILPSGRLPELSQSDQLTSGLWLLFHTLTVSLYDINSPITSEISSGCELPPNNTPLVREPRTAVSTTPKELADVILLTVDSFFGCDICRVHFRHAFGRCAAGRCDWVSEKSERKDPAVADSHAGIVLWLWRFHNIVTFRIALEKTAESIVSLQQIKSGGRATLEAVNDYLITYEGKDVRFPPPEQCESCRKGPLQDIITKNMTGKGALTEDSFKLSNDLVKEAIDRERFKRGIPGAKPAKALRDSVLDRIEDFDLQKVLQYMHNYFWRDDWRNSLVDLHWNPDKQLFNVSNSLLEVAEDIPSSFRGHQRKISAEPDGPISAMELPVSAFFGTTPKVAFLGLSAVLVSIAIFIGSGASTFVDSMIRGFELKRRGSIKVDHASPVSGWRLEDHPSIGLSGRLSNAPDGVADARNRSYPLSIRR